MSKRQQIRKGITLLMFFLFPITITWLSPALPLIYAIFGGVLTGAAMIFILQFISSLFLGRAFCGYLCIGSGIHECLKCIGDKEIKNPKIRFIKYIIWIPWLLAIIYFFIKTGGINQVDFFAGTLHNYMFLTASYRYIIYFGVILLITLLHISVGKRAFCYTVCWMSPFMVIGTKMSELLRLPRLRLKANQDTCINCNLCTKKCPMSLDVKSMVLNNNMKNSECILCGECVDVCPKGVLEYIFKKRV